MEVKEAVMDISNLYTRGVARVCSSVTVRGQVQVYCVIMFIIFITIWAWRAGGGARASMRHAHSHGHQHSRAGDLCGTAAGARQYLVSM